MRQVEAFEAENAFEMLLDLVECGEEVVITRHGRSVARLMPVGLKPDRSAAMAAAERIRRRAREKCVSFDCDEWKEFRNEGRP